MIRGFLPTSPERLFITVATALGGIALKGMSRSTHDGIMREIVERRAALLDALQLRTVNAARHG